MKAANKAGTRRDFLPAGNTKIKKLWGDRIFDIVNALIMILICVIDRPDCGKFGEGSAVSGEAVYRRI